MGGSDFKLLDCSLRDGGYVNDWNWGYDKAREIIRKLVQAQTDIVEVGFLRNINSYNKDITVCNHIEELNKLLPENQMGTMFSAMAMRSNYDISKLSDYNGNGIQMIRITAHDYDIREGMDFAREVKNKGYKISINPINIMGYSDKEILWILDQVNEIQPYQFSIVDTFGSMKRRDLDRIVSLVDNNLDRKVRLGLHLHENMALSFSLVQNYVDRNLQRPITIDGSLMGIGRIPGNLPIELIVDYLNEYCGAHYDIDYLMDAIEDYIAPIKGQTKWGYTPAYFLSARFNLHRNYAEHYLKKGDLTNRDINHLLAQIDKKKKNAFDSEYADELYYAYLNNKIDDLKDFSKLKEIFKDKKVMVVAPGKGLVTYKEKISNYINEENPLVVACNFVLDYIEDAVVFFSNQKRLDQVSYTNKQIILTSNLETKEAALRVNYNRISGDFNQGCNSLILLLRLLQSLGVQSVVLAGADGYSADGNNYFNTVLRNYTRHDKEFNEAVALALKKINLQIEFLTPSAYEGY